MLTENDVGKSTVFETSIKIMAIDRNAIDQIIEALNASFECKTTSPKMYSSEKDAFFQYVAILKRRA